MEKIFKKIKSVAVSILIGLGFFSLSLWIVEDYKGPISKVMIIVGLCVTAGFLIIRWSRTKNIFIIIIEILCAVFGGIGSLIVTSLIPIDFPEKITVITMYIVTALLSVYISDYFAKPPKKAKKPEAKKAEEK